LESAIAAYKAALVDFGCAVQRWLVGHLVPTGMRSVSRDATTSSVWRRLPPYFTASGG